MRQFKLVRFGFINEVFAKENPTFNTKTFSRYTGFQVVINEGEDGGLRITGIPGIIFNTKKQALAWFQQTHEDYC